MLIVDTVAYFIYVVGSFVWPYFWPIAGTIALGKIAWTLWMHYIQQDFISGIDFVLLEVIPPRDVLRSPKAMELFFVNAFYHFSVKGGREEIWQGAVWFWFSLEIVSIDGQVHFYIRTPTRVRGLIETQMYAQYPQAQIKEVEDYTLAVDKISPDSDWNLWGCEFGLEKPSAYPIKTYVDFGLDKDPKEEFKVDPISSVIELFGSIQKGEQMWMQIVITPSKEEFPDHDAHGFNFFKKKTHDWVRESEVVLDNLLKPFTAVKKQGNSSDDNPQFAMEIRAPDKYKPLVDGITRKSAKLGFDTGIRVCYVAKKEAWNLNSRRNIRLLLRQYANPSLNAFARMNSTQADAYGGLIFVLSPEEVMQLSNRMLEEYRERSFFHLYMRHHLLSDHILPWPITPLLFKAYKHPPTYVLNVEELATLWHFPGQILKVPTLERIESKEASPPTNLPI